MLQTSAPLHSRKEKLLPRAFFLCEKKSKPRQVEAAFLLTKDCFLKCLAYHGRARIALSFIKLLASVVPCAAKQEYPKVI